MVQSALEKTVGVTGLKVPGQEGPHPSVKVKDQVIQYSGSAAVDRVIGILHERTHFKVRVATREEAEEARLLGKD